MVLGEQRVVQAKAPDDSDNVTARWVRGMRQFECVPVAGVSRGALSSGAASSLPSGTVWGVRQHTLPRPHRRQTTSGTHRLLARIYPCRCPIATGLEWAERPCYGTGLWKPAAGGTHRARLSVSGPRAVERSVSGGLGDRDKDCAGLARHVSDL